MKKWIALVLSLLLMAAMMTAFAACGGGSSSGFLRIFIQTERGWQHPFP